MLQDRLTILKAVGPLTGSEEAWEKLVNAWPGDTLEEGVVFWSFLTPAAPRSDVVPHVRNFSFGEEKERQRVYAAMEAKFGSALWEHPDVNAVEAVYRAYKGFPGLMKENWDDQLATQISVMAFFMNVISETYRTQQREAGTWGPRLARWFTRPGDSNQVKDHLIQTTLEHGWVDPWIEVNGTPLPLYLRQPQDLAAWVKGGGDLDRLGVDPAHPDQPLWATLSARHPGLRDELVKSNAAARQALVGQPSSEQAALVLEKLEALKNKSRGTIPRDEWWTRLTSDPQWPQLRARKGDTPLWLAVLHQCPAVLPLLIKEADTNLDLRSHLKDTNRQGEGVWHVLLNHADSKSVTQPLLEKLAHWVPPTLPSLWMGHPLKSTTLPLAYRDLDKTAWTYLKYAKSQALSAVLPLSIILGNADQQQAWVKQWPTEKDREFIKSLSEKEWSRHASAIHPSVRLTSAILNWLPALLQQKSNTWGGSSSQSTDAFRAFGMHIRTALQAEGVQPESVLDAMNRFQIKNKASFSKEGHAEFETVRGLIFATCRQQQAAAVTLATAHRRHRQRS